MRVNNEKIVLEMVEEGNLIVTTKEVEAMGISSKTITRLVEKGYLRKISRGVYVDSKRFNDIYYEKQSRARKGIFSHESAFYLLGILDRKPDKYKISIMSHYNTRIITHEDNEFYYMKKEKFYPGIITVETKEGNLVRIFDADRTMCDIIKYEKRISKEKLFSLISKYLNYPKKDFKALVEYANILDVRDEIFKYFGI